MNYVLIIHEVSDYAVWKKVFDGAAKIRKDAGEISYQLLRVDNEKNKIIHFSMWNSLHNARLFFESPQLIQLREEAGVIAPDFIYSNQIESKKL